MLDIKSSLAQLDLIQQDKPYYIKGFLKSPEEIVAWQDIENCLNNPVQHYFELINADNEKIAIPANETAWVSNKLVQDKKFIFDAFNKGMSLIITSYGFYSNKTQEFLAQFESMYDVNSALHIYCGLEGSNSFKIHADYPANFIVQAFGKTRWKIFANKISSMYNITHVPKFVDTSVFEVVMDVELEPGDALYIPSRTYHAAYPTEKRISISVPCWDRDPSVASSDRNVYRINW